MLSFSVVINTYNRAEGLRKTLESLLMLAYPRFEIVVVNGPSTDHTDEVIEAFSSRIKAAKCDVRNLSVSRNIGICAAAGDIVAFIDDDAMPEPEWISQLASAYDDPSIGAVGGKVFDHTGYHFQYEYATADRLGNAQWQLSEATPHLNFPYSMRFPYLQGTNTSYRRHALLEIGGFDEEYEYYLDETDVCLRMNDRGYVIRQLPDAYVHHKFLPSHVRDENRVAKYRYPVVKNKIYFALKNARNHVGMQEIVDDVRRFVEGQFADVDFHIAGGRLGQGDRQQLTDDVNRAWDRALERGMSAGRELINGEKLDRHGCPFKSALKEESAAAMDARTHIVLVSRDYPPGHAGGIATFNRDLAVELAGLGHTIVVVTESKDINRVDFEDGVWVHRIVKQSFPLGREAIELKIPQHIWDWSATAFEEVKRIESHRRIDVVETPVWDCEGIAFVLDRKWPLVVSLQTTLHFWLESHPEQRAEVDWMNNFGVPMLDLEKYVMCGADGVRSISAAIASEIENAYSFRFDRSRLQIQPLGLAPVPSPAPARTASDDDLTVLFVGRLEARKGIDVLLQALPEVLSEFPSIRVRILGDNSLIGPDGNTYQQKFLSQAAGKKYVDRVSFEGRVDDAVLRSAYASCDVFVGPSRFESFGLVFLEAMREGKPVIGCRAGGMPEVIKDGETGVLVTPGNSSELAQALLRLLSSKELRSRLGENARGDFRERFTAARMARDSLGLFALAKAIWSGHNSDIEADGKGAICNDVEQRGGEARSVAT